MGLYLLEHTGILIHVLRITGVSCLVYVFVLVAGRAVRLREERRELL